MSATFYNMRRRIAAQKAAEQSTKPVAAVDKPVDKPTETPKKGKVKKDG